MFLGVDLSLTATGICVSTGGRLDCHTINPGARTGYERLGYVRDAVLGYGGKFIAVEGLAFSRNLPSAQERAALWHMVGFEWWRRQQDPVTEVRIIVVGPSVLKKFACGVGKAEKSMMLREVWRRWNVEAKDDNQADAAGLCQIARCWAGEIQPETQAQREVMDKLRNPLAKAKKAKKAA